MMINGRFARLWAGETISQFGDRVTELALPLIAVLTLAATPAEVGLLTAAVWTPNLLGLLVGSWTDQRIHRKRILVAADLLRAAVLISLPVAYVLGVVTLAQLFVVALLSGAGQVFFMSAYQSFFVAVVDRDRYIDANSRLSFSRSASYVAGPAVGGILIQIFTAPVAVLVDAVSFLASALLIGRIPVEPEPAQPHAPLLADARAGLRYVLSHRYLRASLGCVTTVNFFTFAAQALVVLFASRTLGLPSGLIGLAFGIGAVGGLLGAGVAPRLSRRYGAGRVIVAGAVVFPASIAVMAAAHGPHLLTATTIGLAEAFGGAAVMLFDINLNAMQTAVTADNMRSRVAGVFSTINYGARPLGAVVGGVLGGTIGVRPTLLIAAAGGMLCCLWLLRSPIPEVRTIDDELALAA
jgi:MFS family permease